MYVKIGNSKRLDAVQIIHYTCILKIRTSSSDWRKFKPRRNRYVATKRILRYVMHGYCANVLHCVDPETFRTARALQKLQMLPCRLLSTHNHWDWFQLEVQTLTACSRPSSAWVEVREAHATATSAVHESPPIRTVDSCWRIFGFWGWQRESHYCPRLTRLPRVVSRTKHKHQCQYYHSTGPIIYQQPHL